MDAQAAGPENWELNFQPAVTPVMERVHSFHDLLLVVIFLIVVFVLALLGYTCFRFREAKNPEPTTRSHNTLLEIAWTAVPVLILVIIAIPSFKLLYFMDVIPETEMTVKATGNQWYWTYEYPDHDNLTFDANLVADADLKPGQPRLLQTDNAVVLPVDTNIQVVVTSNDVLHSWAMPPMGVKIDAIPGFLNEIWINIQEPGTYYGQCSELCGIRHGFMPITIEAMAKSDFEKWVATQQTAALIGDVHMAENTSR
ncbi:MAG: cytochrome c oxidase subunit II [Pseudomonadota bacterium]